MANARIVANAGDIVLNASTFAARASVNKPPGLTHGQTEGQINRLKTLKQAMYGRAGVDLLCARMMPFRVDPNHTN
jgi:hypothetical protein